MSFQDYAGENLGATATGTRNEYRADCISCGKENHLYINTAKGVAHCFVCGYAVNFLRLIQDLEGVSFPIAMQRLSQIQQGIDGPKKARTLDALYELLMGGAEQQTEEQVITLPKYCVPINTPEARPARDYLRSRGFNARHYKPYGLYYVAARDDDAPHFTHHIVFPLHASNGALNFFTTRAAYEPKKGRPKSFHAKGSTLSPYFLWCPQ